MPIFLHIHTLNHINRQMMSVWTLTTFVAFELVFSSCRSLCVATLVVCFVFYSIAIQFNSIPFHFAYHSFLPFLSHTSFFFSFVRYRLFAIINVRQNQTAWDCVVRLYVCMFFFEYTQTQWEPWPCISTRNLSAWIFFFSSAASVSSLCKQTGKEKKGNQTHSAVFPQCKMYCTLKQAHDINLYKYMYSNWMKIVCYWNMSTNKIKKRERESEWTKKEKLYQSKIQNVIGLHQAHTQTYHIIQCKIIMYAEVSKE